MTHFIHVNGWNKAVTKEIEIQTRLSRMNKNKLIEEGKPYGLEFCGHCRKADMIVELAAAILEKEGLKDE